MQRVTLVGIDLGKHSFHLHGQDRGSSRPRRSRYKRSLPNTGVANADSRPHKTVSQIRGFLLEFGDYWQTGRGNSALQAVAGTSKKGLLPPFLLDCQ